MTKDWWFDQPMAWLLDLILLFYSYLKPLGCIKHLSVNIPGLQTQKLQTFSKGVPLGSNLNPFLTIVYLHVEQKVVTM